MTAHLSADKYAVGEMLRSWRTNKKVSQLSLASAANVSAKHLSFVENGRSMPSRKMILKLSEYLEIPLRHRNKILLAAGFPPAYHRTAITEPKLGMIRDAIRRVLATHDPYPAFVVDKEWNLVEANESLSILTEDCPPELAAEPFNVLRFSLHPEGLGRRIVNITEWRNHILDRLQRQVQETGSASLAELYRELKEYPHKSPKSVTRTTATQVVMPMVFRKDGCELSFFSTVTTFGAPFDITVEELLIESFFPTDTKTADFLRKHRRLRDSGPDDATSKPTSLARPRYQEPAALSTSGREDLDDDLSR